MQYLSEIFGECYRSDTVGPPTTPCNLPSCYDGRCYCDANGVCYKWNLGAGVWDEIPGGGSTILIEKPTIIAPTEGTTSFTGPYTSSVYATDISFLETHYSSDWEWATDSDFTLTSIVESYYNDTTNLTEVPSPDATILLPSTTYFVRVRYKSLGAVSDWSDEGVSQGTTGFTADPVIIETPTVAVDGSPSYVPETPYIYGGTYTITGSSDAHVSTDWSVIKVSDGSLVWSSIGNTTHLEKVMVPSGTLTITTEYKFTCRYNSASFSSTVGSTIATTKDKFGIVDISGPIRTEVIAAKIQHWSLNSDGNTFAAGSEPGTASPKILTWTKIDGVWQNSVTVTLHADAVIENQITISGNGLIMWAYWVDSGLMWAQVFRRVSLTSPFYALQEIDHNTYSSVYNGGAYPVLNYDGSFCLVMSTHWDNSISKTTKAEIHLYHLDGDVYTKTEEKKISKRAETDGGSYLTQFRLGPISVPRINSDEPNKEVFTYTRVSANTNMIPNNKQEPGIITLDHNAAEGSQLSDLPGTPPGYSANNEPADLPNPSIPSADGLTFVATPSYNFTNTRSIRNDSGGLTWEVNNADLGHFWGSTESLDKVYFITYDGTNSQRDEYTWNATGSTYLLSASAPYVGVTGDPLGTSNANIAKVGGSMMSMDLTSTVFVTDEKNIYFY